MSIKSFVNSLYQKGNSVSDKFQKSCLYYNIIQIKAENIDLENENESLYKDIKQFLGFYITSFTEENKDFGYDTINLNKILTAIKFCRDASKRISLSNYAELVLAKYGFNDKSHYFKKDFKFDYLKALWQKGDRGKCLAILSVPFYNLYTCIGLILLIFIVYYLATLPLSSNENAWFMIQEENVCENELLNHLFNYLCSFVDLNEKTFCRPNGWKGFIAIVGFKLIWALTFSGILLKYIKGRIHLEITEYD